MRPAVYVIGEDVVAVDGEQGDVFRAQWNARYESSAPFRTLLARLDWLWGLSGVLVAGATIGVIFGVKQDAVGWAVGRCSAVMRGDVLEGPGLIKSQAGQSHGSGLPG